MHRTSRCTTATPSTRPPGTLRGDGGGAGWDPSDGGGPRGMVGMGAASEDPHPTCAARAASRLSLGSSVVGSGNPTAGAQAA